MSDFGDSSPDDLEDLCRCGWCRECVEYGIDQQAAQHDTDLPSLSAADLERDLDLPPGSINTDPKRYNK